VTNINHPEFDFSTLQIKAKNTLEPVLIMKSGTFRAKASILAHRQFITFTSSLQIGSDRVNNVKVTPIDGTTDIEIQPVMQEGVSTIPIKWSKNNKELYFDLTKFLALRPIIVQRGTKVYIPMVLGTALNTEPTLVLKISELHSEIIGKGKKRGSKSTEESTAKSAETPKEEPA
jgi:hypothetical protein